MVDAIDSSLLRDHDDRDPAPTAVSRGTPPALGLRLCLAIGALLPRTIPLAVKDLRLLGLELRLGEDT
jgi:hypothetical protein